MSWLNNSLVTIKGQLTHLAQEVLADTAGPGDDEYRGPDQNTKTAVELLAETQELKEQLEKSCEDKDREVSVRGNLHSSVGHTDCCCENRSNLMQLPHAWPRAFAAVAIAAAAAAATVVPPLKLQKLHLWDFLQTAPAHSGQHTIAWAVRPSTYTHNI